MKMVFVLAICLCGSLALASDRLENQIACATVQASGQADQGFSLILQGNATAWRKNVAVFEHGYLGSQHVADISVPLQPTLEADNRGFIPEDIEIYEGQGLRLEIRVLRIDGRPLSGLGHVRFTRAGGETTDADLSCRALTSDSATNR